MKTYALSLLILASLASCANPNHRSTSRQPTSWARIALQNVDPDAGAISVSDELGLALEGGQFVREFDEYSVGWEALLHYSRHDASYVDPAPPNNFFAEEPTNLKVGVGGRIARIGHGPFSPYARGGLLYQYIYDDLLDDAGVGYYVGAGLDYQINDTLSIGPSILFSSASLSDIDVDEVALGVGLTFLF